MKKIHSPSQNILFERVTKIILSFVLADAAYIFAVVQKMTENPSLAMERYHSVPLMTEHVLAAVVVYLICMVLMSKAAKQ